MNLIIIRINGVLYYSHHKSNLYPGIWFKKYKQDASFVLIYSEITDGLMIGQPVKIGEKQTIIELVDLDFWTLVQSENTNKDYSQLKIAI